MNLKDIKEFILERNLTNVMNVANLLPSPHILKFTTDYILETNLTNVMNVENLLRIQYAIYGEF